MEQVRPNPVDVQFSNRIFSRFRPNQTEGGLKSSPKKEPEPPAHKIIYNRSGNLATTTQLDQKVTDEYMRRVGMRRDIIIEDTDNPPERNSVAVSSDTLAFRAIEPLRKLTEVRLKPKPPHTLVYQNDRFIVQVHEREIDEKTRAKHPTDITNYNEQFLEQLNTAVRGGLAEVLSFEKLGWRDNSFAYGGYWVGTFNRNGLCHI